MDIKNHMLIFFFISMLVYRGKKWGTFKMDVVIRKVGDS
jgi:hypothetical protein